MEEKLRHQITQFLTEKINPHGLRCPMCGQTKFELLGKYIVPPAQDDMKGLRLGETFPMVGIVCVNCGFVAHHLVGVVSPDSLLKKDS